MPSIDSLGSRAQVAATVRAMKDAQGNRDGIHGNENQPAGSVKGVSRFEHEPWLDRVRAFFQVGLTSTDERRQLLRFLAEKERAWGSKVSQLPDGGIRDDGQFRVQKAIALTRFGRTPSEVTEGFVEAKGTVAGQPIATRQLFWQRWKPIGEPNGKMVVISPGFQGTGRRFYEQIDLMNRRGYDVIVMDHQWAGYSQGEPGGVDRGYGIARDVAAVSAFAAKELERDYGRHPNKQLILMGSSLGAGPGVFAAITLNDAGDIRLEGAQMPKRLNAVLQVPFFNPTPNALNVALGVATAIPVIEDLAIPVPAVSSDDVTARAKAVANMTAEDIRSQPRVFHATQPDLKRVVHLAEGGVVPTGRVYIIHGEKDELADPDWSRRITQHMGDRAKLKLLPTKNHLMQEHPTDQREVLTALEWLSESPAR
jgi:alpha-beta hydrolase superfamily lysophospholipase